MGSRTVSLRPLLILFVWLGIAAALYAVSPSLDAVVAKQDLRALPSSAPSANALVEMDREFGTGRSRSFLIVVIENKSGLTSADAALYTGLVEAFRSTSSVAQVQDYVSNPRLRASLMSGDGQATYIPIGLTAEFGSPRASEQLRDVRNIVRRAGPRAGTEVLVTGDSALTDDLLAEVDHSATRVELISFLLMVGILGAIYRRALPVVVPLVNIGVASTVTQSALALLGERGLPLSSFSGSFVLAIILGAGTDYSIFLISRFREELSQTNGDVPSAVVRATRRMTGALLASAMTVAVACTLLTFTHLLIFRTTGLGMAIAVLVTIATSLTITPALLLLLGHRIGPTEPPGSSVRWRQISRLVTTRPVAVLLGGVTFLGILASFALTQLSYDPRSASTDKAPSVRALDVLDVHFGRYTTEPDYLMIRVQQGLTSRTSLALIDAVTRNIAQVPGIRTVTSLTRPNGIAPTGAPATDSVGAGSDGQDEMRSPNLASARDQFLSKDQRTTRIAIIGRDSPGSGNGLKALAEAKEVVRTTLAGTALSSATLTSTGSGSTTEDIKSYFDSDFIFALVAVLLTVLLLLVITFRSLIAPLYLLGSVILSYGAAMGLTVLVFVRLLGEPLQYPAPVLAFVLLIAVGADYNILLMSRMREAGRPLTRETVGAAVTSTGPVITSAGLIFASTFVASIGSPLPNIAQVACAMVFGLLLDTFVVRSLIVPAAAALFRDASWWPSLGRRSPSLEERGKARLPGPEELRQ